MLIRDASRLSGITPEGGMTATELAERGPWGEPVIRNRVDDTSTGGAGSGVPNERSDGQLGSVPLYAIRWMVWGERMVEIPSTSLDRWTIVGPCEIHGTAGTDQAPVMPEIGPGTMPNRRRRLNFNAGRSAPRYFDVGPLALDEWVAMKMGVFYSNEGNGWLVLVRNGQVVLERLNEPITVETARGYFKYANYRNRSINGPQVWDMTSCRVYDTDPGPFLLPASPAPPPSIPADTARPVIVVRAPARDYVATPGQPIPFEAEVADDSGTLSRVWIGRVSSDGNLEAGPFTSVPSGTVLRGSLPAPPPGVSEVHFYAAGRDAAGNEATPAAYALTVQAAPPPPDPEPDPTDPCADIAAERDAAQAEAAGLRDLVAERDRDLAGAREARDQAIETAQRAMGERDEARAVIAAALGVLGGL